jgi:hypothetical protein
VSDQPAKLGSPAPNVTLAGERDEPVALSALWTSAERGIVLSFLRHYG